MVRCANTRSGRQNVSEDEVSVEVLVIYLSWKDNISSLFPMML